MQDESCRPQFEEVYPRNEFAPLISLVLNLAEWVKSRPTQGKGRPGEGRAGDNVPGAGS